MNNRKYTPQETADNMLVMALANTEFPIEAIPDGFVGDLKNAMRYASVGGFAQQGFDRPLFIKMRDWQPPFSAAAMHLCIKLVQCTTLAEMGADATEAEYDQMQDRAEAVYEQYVAIKQPIGEKIQREINAKVKASQGAPIGHNIFKG